MAGLWQLEGPSPGLHGMQVSHGDTEDNEWGGELHGRRPGRQPGGSGVAEAEGAGPLSNEKRRGPLELPGARREVSWEGQCSRQAQ